MKNLKILIVEDEQLSADYLKSCLLKVKNRKIDIDVVDCVSRAEEILTDNDYQLILLDIHLKNKSGFDLLDSKTYKKKYTPIIFVTAFDEYAIKAFKYSAVDYLLKPVDFNELSNAINKAIKTRYGTRRRKFSVLNGHIEQEKLTNLVVPTSDTLEFIPLSEIFFCMADGSYSEIHSKAGKLVASKTLKSIEELLTDFGFHRVHSSFLVNLGQVSKYMKGKGGQVVLKNGTLIPVSTRRREEFLRRIRENGL